MSNVLGAITHGYESLIVKIESQFSNGLPQTIIVGLGGKSVDESKERIRAAFNSSGISYPKKKTLINLAPADIQKK